MPTVTAETRQLSKLDADTLADLYCTGRIDEDTLAAIDAADEAARQAKAKRDAKRQEQRSEWYLAAHAQYEQASHDCRGHLFHPRARTAEDAPGSELQLWTGSEAWARSWASEDLCQWWDANGGRLSLARWQREQASQARAYRDERDLAALAEQVAAAEARPSARDLAIAAATRPAAPAARPEGSIAGMIRALGHLTRAVETNTSAWERAVARVNGGKQA